MGQVARQLVQVDERLRREDEVETALQFLEAEPALGEMLVQLGSETVPVGIRRPWPRGPAAPGACAQPAPAGLSGATEDHLRKGL